MKVILVVQPWRTDYYRHLKNARNIEWILLWYEKPSQMNASIEDLPLTFKEIIFWQDYKTPRDLIKKVQPDRIFFYEIIDFRQISLIVFSKSLNIPTYYSDHGAAADKEDTLKFVLSKTFKKHTLPYLINRLKNNFFDALRSKFFYFSVTRGFKSWSSYFKYVLLPFKTLASSSHPVLLRNKFPERVPMYPIVFNEPNFEDFETYTGVAREQVFFTGVPFFDSYFQSQSNTGDYIVYIEHPYYEEELANWTLEHHQKVKTAIIHFANEVKTKIFIKLHPRSNPDLWTGIESEFIKVYQDGDFTELYLNAKLILSFSSSLVTAFLCVRKNVVLLGWNPEPHIEGSDFSTTGLCHVSFNTDDLFTMYQFWLENNLSEINGRNYDTFIRKYNYPFDGQATQRILNLIYDPPLKN